MKTMCRNIHNKAKEGDNRRNKPWEKSVKKWRLEMKRGDGYRGQR
jgi:hypothetical protein